MAKVASEHAGANAAIDVLRDAAERLKALGAECLRLEEERDQALADLHAERLAEERAAVALSTWTDLLQDFRLGVRDADELIAETVGRHG